MKKALKIFLTILAVLLLFTFSSAFFMSHQVDKQLSDTYTYEVRPLDFQSDSTLISLGSRLVTVKGCTDCHGGNLAGKVVIDDPAIGRIVAGNLTSGKGGLPESFSIRDWQLALQHGVSAEGRPLLLMPSYETAALSEKDLSAIIAYCKSLPPVNTALPESEVGTVGKVLTYLGQFPMTSVDRIDHNYVPIEDAEHLSNLDLGKYLSVSCVGCHRDNLKGGKAIIPGSPVVPDITGTGKLAGWSEEAFRSTLRTGRTPEGKQMENQFMPYSATQSYTDKEISALYAYLVSLK